MTRKVLFIAYNFPPAGGSGVHRNLKFAKYLADFGYEPLVVTIDASDIAEVIDQTLNRDAAHVKVWRVPNRLGRLAGKLAGSGFWPVTSFFVRPGPSVLWKRPVLQTAREIVATEGVDLIYTSTPPRGAAVIGAALKHDLRVPLVVDYRDPWTASAYDRAITRWHHAVDRRCEARVIAAADALVFQTPGMVDLYQHSFPAAAERMRLIYNGYDPEDFAEDLPKPSDGPDLNLAFAGVMYDKKPRKSKIHKAARRILQGKKPHVDFSTITATYLFRAMRQLFDEEPEYKDRLSFDIAGNVPSDHPDEVESLGLGDQVRFHGYLPHERAIRLISKSDVAFLPLFTVEDDPHNYIIPGKIFEYMGQRKPILAAVPEGDAAELVREVKIGWVVDPYDIVKIREQLARLIELKGQGMVELDPDEEMIAQFDRSVLTGQLARVFDKVLDGPAAQADTVRQADIPRRAAGSRRPMTGPCKEPGD